MTTNIIQFPTQQIDIPFSPELQAVTAAVDNLSEEDTDLLFSYLWAMGYGETTPAPTSWIESKKNTITKPASVGLVMPDKTGKPSLNPVKSGLKYVWTLILIGKK